MRNEELIAQQPALAINKSAEIGLRFMGTIFGALLFAAALLLAGHTHGGQFVPWTYVVGLQQPYVAGLHRHGGTWIYVTRGAGYWGPPLRLGVPPEIALLTLEPAEGQTLA